ncbi:unnamed protein product, partial [Staurois parvus]
MLLPRSRVSHGSLYGPPHCCSRPSPQCSAMSTFRSPHILLVCFSIFCHRVLADYGTSHCCCQARNLPWAPVPPPHAAARSRVVSNGSLYGLHCSHVSIAHTLPCATFRSPHTLLVWFHFVSEGA